MMDKRQNLRHTKWCRLEVESGMIHQLDKHLFAILKLHVAFGELDLDTTFEIVGIPVLLGHDRLVELGKAQRLHVAFGVKWKQVRGTDDLGPGDILWKVLDAVVWSVPWSDRVRQSTANSPRVETIDHDPDLPYLSWRRSTSLSALDERVEEWSCDPGVDRDLSMLEAFRRTAFPISHT